MFYLKDFKIHPAQTVWHSSNQILSVYEKNCILCIWILNSSLTYFCYFTDQLLVNKRYQCFDINLQTSRISVSTFRYCIYFWKRLLLKNLEFISIMPILFVSILKFNFESSDNNINYIVLWKQTFKKCVKYILFLSLHIWSFY